MKGFFSMDGLFYKIGNILYYLIISNILWIIFSIPLFTIGASTTALFYVMGRVVKDDDVQVFKNFWSSFKSNLKQSTIIWLIIAAISFILYMSIRNVSILGGLSKFVLPVQLAIAFQVIIITMYIFPLLSGFNMGIICLFKTSLLLGNRHLLTTLLCLSCLFVSSFLLFYIPGLLILFFMSLNALCLSFLTHRIFKKYMTKDDTKRTSSENCNAETNNSLQ